MNPQPSYELLRDTKKGTDRAESTDVRGGKLGHFRRTRGDSTSCTPEVQLARAARIQASRQLVPDLEAGKYGHPPSAFVREQPRDSPLELDSDRLLL